MPAIKKLQEGSWYNFDVIKLISIDKENDFFVLSDIWDTKYLLEVEAYKGYQIKTGEQLYCRVDKINCSGKIFLEPKHPHYSEEEVYLFKVIEPVQLTNSLGLTESAVLVEDDFQNRIIVPNPENADLSGTVACRVDKIKKGMFFLSLVGSKKTLTGIKEGDWLTLRIVGMITLVNHQEYWVLNDAKGNSFQIKRKTYENYGLALHSEIDCRIVKIKSSWECIVEPRHPNYTIGQKYHFVIEGKTKEKVDGDEIHILSTLDVFKNKVKIPVNAEQFKSIQQGDSVVFQVVKIKHSLLSLELQ